MSDTPLQLLNRVFGYPAFRGAQQAIVESLEPRWTDVVDMNLEDAFIEYTRGSKRSLPIFHRENNRVDRATV